MATSASRDEASPGLVPDMSIGMSLTERTNPSVGNKPRPSATPLLYISSDVKQQEEKGIQVLSDIYPGVDSFLHQFHPNCHRTTSKAPPTAPPTQIPLLFIPPFKSYKSNDVHDVWDIPGPRPPTDNLNLPDINIRPFVPQLLPLVPPNHVTSLPLLHLDDPISIMKRDGFQLLQMPSLPTTTAATSSTETLVNPIQVNLTLHKPKKSHKRSHRKFSLHYNNSSHVTSSNNNRGNIDPSSPDRDSADGNEPHPQSRSMTTPLPADDDNLSSSMGPHCRVTQSSSPHTSSTTITITTPITSGGNDKWSRNSSRSGSPTTIVSPKTVSIAVQVDMETPASEEDGNKLISLSQVREMETLDDFHQSPRHYTAVSDVVEDTDDDQSQTRYIIKNASPPLSLRPLSRSQSPHSLSRPSSPHSLSSLLSPRSLSPPLSINPSDPMGPFKLLEKQLLAIEYTTNDIKDDLMTSKRILQSIDRLHDKTTHNTITSNNKATIAKGTSPATSPNEIDNISLVDRQSPLPQPIINERSMTLSQNSERDDRSNLRKWMNKKFKERHTLYKTHREELRKKERVPYSATPTVKPPLSKTIHQRRVQDKENFELRLSSAQELMDDLMSSSKQFSSSGGRPGNKTAQRENHPQSIKNESFKSERESGSSKRLISSVEGLNERERKKMAEILASTEYEKGSTASNSTIINTSLDWSEVDDLL